MTLKKTFVWGWGLGSIGLAVVHNTLNVLLMAYLIRVVGIEPALAGTIVLATKLVDVLTDMPVGWLSDRTHSRFGRRRPFMLAAALITPAAAYLLFTAGPGGQTQAIISLLLLSAVGYTLFNVPYLSMPAEMTKSPDVRTHMVGIRSSAIALGTLFGISAAPIIVGQLGGGAAGYNSLALIMAGAIFVAFFGSFTSLNGAPDHAAGDPPSALLQQLRSIIKGRSYQMLLAIKILHLLGLAVGAGSLLFFFTGALKYDATMLGLYGMVTTLTWTIVMPLWTWLANRIGKRKGYMLATALYTIVTLTWLLAEPQEPFAQLYGRAFMFGILSGGMLLMGNGMLQDIMDDDFRKNGERRNGVFAASYSLTEKITSGLAAQILGFILAYTGYQRGAEEQSPDAISGLYFSVGFVPAICMGASLLFIYYYTLSEEDLRS
ncbi:MAG: MFS transporter [Kordiimonadaceae bacterium]|nr:MFS transporter [Kordiimonadaceae bacterium]MBO6567320.1 MFS transporter [Kordiimonadaceae bacterium]MBO6963466.1 MFS transporter [Kordiimonadaceae bacterium]